MREHEKTASDVETIRSGMESSSLGAEQLSKNQHTTDEPRRQGIVESTLRRGERNAIPASELIGMVGASGLRDLQHMIEQERLNGALILARPAKNGGGYYLPDYGPKGHAELLQHYRRVRASCLSSLTALKHIRQALGYIDGQLKLSDLEEEL